MPKIMETAQTAFKHFTDGLATGQWSAFLDMLTEDFTFWFPVGPFQGTNVGKARASEFFPYVTEKIFTQGLSVTLQRITSNETTVVFEIQSEGQMLGHAYQNQAAISFDVRENQICGYREYLGVLFQINAPPSASRDRIP
ncbi:MAG: nuclear transport factor 2 family protein [Microcystaceae cyanobacterium]